MTSGPAALLIALLHAQDQPVSYVPAKLVIRMSGAFAGEGKTDAKDATTIAETARLRSDLAAIIQSDKVIVELQVFCAARRPCWAAHTASARHHRQQVGHDGVVAAGGVVEDTRPVASIGFGAGASEHMPGRV
jgi:hypothetical protein